METLGKKHRLDTNVFILFKKEEEHLYFIIQIEAFSWLGFVAGFFFFFQVQVENYFI